MESQAALGGMAACGTHDAVQLLRGLGIAGVLSYETWDVLSAPLDSTDTPLDNSDLQRVFEAYCLAVLRNSGPTPCEILMPQLLPAGQEFYQSVLGSATASREKLLQALRNAGIVSSLSVSQLGDGHMVLFDVWNPGECS